MIVPPPPELSPEAAATRAFLLEHHEHGPFHAIEISDGTPLDLREVNVGLRELANLSMAHATADGWAAR